VAEIFADSIHAGGGFGFSNPRPVKAARAIGGVPGLIDQPGRVLNGDRIAPQLRYASEGATPIFRAMDACNGPMDVEMFAREGGVSFGEYGKCGRDG
jgi:hypothetical protein